MKRLSLFDFIRHVNRHRYRVCVMACVVAQGAPVSDRAFDAIVQLARWHDVEKWIFLPWLWFWHGGRAGRVARIGFDVMNAAGDLVARAVLREFAASERATAHRYVHAVDVVDRHLDPTARIEFGDIGNPPPLSRFLPESDVRIGEIASLVWPDAHASAATAFPLSIETRGSP